MPDGGGHGGTGGVEPVEYRLSASRAKSNICNDLRHSSEVGLNIVHVHLASRFQAIPELRFMTGLPRSASGWGHERGGRVTGPRDRSACSKLGRAESRCAHPSERRVMPDPVCRPSLSPLAAVTNVLPTCREPYSSCLASPAPGTVSRSSAPAAVTRGEPWRACSTRSYDAPPRPRVAVLPLAPRIA